MRTTTNTFCRVGPAELGMKKGVNSRAQLSLAPAHGLPRTIYAASLKTAVLKKPIPTYSRASRLIKKRGSAVIITGVNTKGAICVNQNSRALAVSSAPISSGSPFGVARAKQPVRQTKERLRELIGNELRLICKIASGQ